MNDLSRFFSFLLLFLVQFVLFGLFLSNPPGEGIAFQWSYALLTQIPRLVGHHCIVTTSRLQVLYLKISRKFQWNYKLSSYRDCKDCLHQNERPQYESNFVTTLVIWFTGYLICLSYDGHRTLLHLCFSYIWT